MAEETDCGLLLDVNNVYVSSVNHDFDPVEYVRSVPHERIVQIHLAGHSNCRTHLIDTHDNHVIDPVWELYRLAHQLTGGVSTLLEWDARIPPFPVVHAEVLKAKQYMAAELQPPPAPAAEFDRLRLERSASAGVCRDGSGVKVGATGRGRGASEQSNRPSTSVAILHAQRGLTLAPCPWTIPESPLDKVQRWMQSVIMHPDGVAAGLDSAAARQHIDVPPEQVEQVISPSQALSSVERLSIYANAYYARLLECLGEEFPVLKQTLGEETFDAFAFGYLQSYPSRSYTLNRLGANFAAFLAETRPAASDDDAEEARARSDADWPDFLIDLATLEWTFSQVFDGPGVEREPLLEATELRNIGIDRWPNARIETVPCLKLLALRFPVNAYYTAARRANCRRCRRRPRNWLAVNRRDYIVRRHEISEPQFVLLTALIEGQTIGAAIERVLELPDANVDQLASQLRIWFHDWAAEGFFRRIVADK